MRLIKQSRLRLTEGKSDKVYEVDLCQLGPGDYVVNFRYGRFGTKLREGSKTEQAVSLGEADRIYNSIVVAKTNKGYAETDSVTPAPQPVALPVVATNSHHPADPRIAALLQQLPKAKGQQSRIVWRLGELRATAAAHTIAKLYNNKSTLLNYSICWALARLGGDQALSTLQEASQRNAGLHVRRIALAGLASLGDASTQLAATTELPTDVRPLLEQQPDQHNTALLLAKAQSKRADAKRHHWLFYLFIAAQNDAHLHRWLLILAEQLPAKAGTFIHLRHWFKAAECVVDAPLYATLCRRFEVEAPAFWRPEYSRYMYVDHEQVELQQELKSPDARLAFSNFTQNYLRKRSARHLRKVANNGSDDYVQMACAILLALKPEDGGQERREHHRHWQSDGNSWYQVDGGTTVYPRFAGNLAMNRILYGNSSRRRPVPSGKAWFLTGTKPGKATTLREEAFPQLWDQAPELLLKLLLQAQLEEVHNFACKAIKVNHNFCEQISNEQLLALLNQPFTCTQAFALERVRARWNANAPDIALLQVLVTLKLDAARAQAMEWINQSTNQLRDELALIAILITAQHQDIRDFASNWLQQQRYNGPQATELLARAIATLLAIDSDTDNIGQQQRIQQAGNTLLHGLSDAVRTLDLSIILDLLNHPLTANQALAGRLLTANQCPAEQLPPELLARLLNSDSADVRATGVTLFGQLPDTMLREQLDLLSSLLAANTPPVRAAARPVAGRLAQQDANVAQQLLHKLLPQLFRAERHEGLHSELLSLMLNELKTGLSTIDQNTIWRLVNAKSKTAQKLGGELLLKQVRHNQISVRQLAGFCNSAELRVRQWAWQGYEASPDRLRAEPADALRGLDSSWADSRAFVRDWVNREFDQAIWTPELLVMVCDSPQEDIQQFGRDLLSRFFTDADGPEYLLRLSQHPSQDVQLFATNYLQRFAGGQPGRIEQLEQYFITVLSQVNRSRVAKARVLTFLGQQARQDQQAAAVAARVLSRQAVTIAIGDKAGCMEVLADISQRWPDLPSAIQRQPVEVRVA